ncbi:UNKNOWN [Stylonychia lemnae]|uniref:Uncharacterized protein n=1 Tax=Stylonychia lemnae TaxID=5949 RepID=A0A078APS3_STYLE|nr:UNKNOWN [Stylonychia lemnae]|eukprot:CDW84365.1 UNKNOWN [Stylonychia lemnae]
MIDFEKQTVEKIIGTEQSARNSENYKQSITTNDESVKSPIQKIRKLKLNTSLKRESNDTSSFIDNLVIFPQTKPAKATNEGQSAKADLLRISMKRKQAPTHRYRAALGRLIKIKRRLVE